MECRPPKDPCAPGKGRYKSLRAMVREYIARKRPYKKEERDYFRGLSLEKAIETAALAKNSEGKRSGHHRRRTPAQLAQGKAKLIALLPKIRQCESFDELHNMVCGMTDEVKGIGELYAYDTAYLIGIRLRLRPKRVYLHAGAREGAKALEFSGSLPYLKPSQLPAELQLLKASEMEDFLCIYEAALGRVRRLRGRKKRISGPR
jgi:hypothetical protein